MSNTSFKDKLPYLSILLCCCLMAASAIGVYTNSVGVFYSKVSADLGVGRGAFALHATLCALTAGFLCPAAAGVIRKYPMHRLILLGSLLSGVSTVLMAFSSNIYLFYLLGILRGIGMTMFSLMPVTTLINNWFKEKHGLAVGIALSFSGLAGAVFSPLFGSLIETVGWRNSFIWMGVIGFALTLPGAFFAHYSPEEIGLLAYGASGAGASSPKGDRAGKSGKNGKSADAGSKKAEKSAAGKGSAVKEALYLPTLILLSLMTVLHTSVTGIAQHFPGMAEWMSQGAAVGAAMVSASMIGNIISKLIIGTLSDRIGPFKASMCMILVNALALAGLLLLGKSSAAVLYGIAFLYGTVYSVGAVGIPLLTRKLFGQKNYSRAYSIMTIFTSVGSASALTIIGLVYDLTGGYTAALIGGLLIDLVNFVLLIVMGKVQTKRG
ncbi:MAG: MFS transporter [Firmicutes bacterium]|nr:MFS transporter [Bacillota bacterium]